MFLQPTNWQRVKGGCFLAYICPNEDIGCVVHTIWRIWTGEAVIRSFSFSSCLIGNLILIEKSDALSIVYRLKTVRYFDQVNMIVLFHCSFVLYCCLLYDSMGLESFHACCYRPLNIEANKTIVLFVNKHGTCQWPFFCFVVLTGPWSCWLLVIDSGLILYVYGNETLTAVCSAC